MKLNFILIAVASLGLAACQPTATEPVPNSSTPVAVEAGADCGIASDTVLDEKALFGAESAYNVAAHAYVTLDGAGKLDAETKARVKPLMVSAYENLKLARGAYTAADGCDLKRYVDLVKTATDRARAFMPASQ